MKLFNVLLLTFGVALIHVQGDDSGEAVIIDAASSDSDEDDSEDLDISEGSVPRVECNGPFEKYSRCGANPSCQRTCENLGEDAIPCVRDSRSCIEGCICVEGYVRADVKGPCIHNNRCPRVRH